AVVMLAAVPAALSVAYAQSQPPAEHPAGPSPEMRARLHDGRIAMIKEALRLDEAQLKLWAPVESQLRAGFAARQKARAEWRQRWEQRGGERPSVAERLDRRSKLLAERAESAKALADAFRPFYASLNNEQKAVAGVVLRRVVGRRAHHGHWFMHRAASGAD